MILSKTAGIFELNFSCLDYLFDQQLIQEGKFMIST